MKGVPILLGPKLPRMSPPPLGPTPLLQRVNARRLTLHCRVCRTNKGAVIQCTKFTCSYAAHAECARLACLELVFEDDPKSGPGARTVLEYSRVKLRVLYSS